MDCVRRVGQAGCRSAKPPEIGAATKGYAALCDAPGNYVLRRRAMVSWNGLLAKKVGLVSGVANEHSIAAGCAQAFHQAGAELVLTCREKSMPFVTPFAKEIEPRLLLPLDVETPGSLESVFAQIQKYIWGQRSRS